MEGAKQEKDHWARYKHTVHKPTSLMVWEYISAHGIGKLHICEDTINTEWLVQELEETVFSFFQTTFWT